MFVTNTDRVRAELENQIVSGQLAPGSTLDEAGLARSFNVSRTPVREALLLLSAQGFVRIVPRAGIYVVQLSAAELAELIETLCHAEALCARLASQRITRLQLQKMGQIQENARSLLLECSGEAYIRYDLSFHGCIYAACGNRFLRERTIHMRKRTEPYRLARQEITLETIDQAWHEHQLIYEALSKGDEDAAKKAALSHMLNRTKFFRDLAEVAPDHLFFGEEGEDEDELGGLFSNTLDAPKKRLKVV